MKNFRFLKYGFQHLLFRIENSKYIQIVINSFGFMFLINIFNNICNLYNMSSSHRIICIFAISFSHIFTTRLYSMYKHYKLLKKYDIYEEDDII